jgi:hypothetical protein
VNYVYERFEEKKNYKHDTKFSKSFMNNYKNLENKVCFLRDIPKINKLKNFIIKAVEKVCGKTISRNLFSNRHCCRQIFQFNYSDADKSLCCKIVKIINFHDVITKSLMRQSLIKVTCLAIFLLQ